MVTQAQLEAKYPHLIRDIRDDAIMSERTRCLILMRGALKCGSPEAIQDALKAIADGSDRLPDATPTPTPGVGPQTAAAHQFLADARAMREHIEQLPPADLGDAVVAIMEERRRGGGRFASGQSSSWRDAGDAVTDALEARQGKGAFVR